LRAAAIRYETNFNTMMEIASSGKALLAMTIKEFV